MDYEITPEDVKSKVDAEEEFTLLDVREPWEFETARIEGASWFPWAMCHPGRIRSWIRRITLWLSAIAASAR